MPLRNTLKKKKKNSLSLFFLILYSFMLGCNGFVVSHGSPVGRVAASPSGLHMVRQTPVHTVTKIVVADGGLLAP
jgi:hypothetical protein